MPDASTSSIVDRCVATAPAPVTTAQADSGPPSAGLVDQLAGPRRPPRRDGAPPSAEELAWILRAATTVPDHGALRPWRFVVVSGEQRDRFGDALARDLVADRGPNSEAVLERMRGKAHAAPTLIALVASPVAGAKVPEWEQACSAACCGYAMVLTAQALGLGAVWKSSPICGAAVRGLFGLGPTEQLLGWVNVGAADDASPVAPRAVPDLSEVVSTLGADRLYAFEPFGPGC